MAFFVAQENNLQGVFSDLLASIRFTDRCWWIFGRAQTATVARMHDEILFVDSEKKINNNNKKINNFCVVVVSFAAARHQRWKIIAGRLWTENRARCINTHSCYVHGVCVCMCVCVCATWLIGSDLSWSVFRWWV